MCVDLLIAELGKMFKMDVLVKNGSHNMELEKKNIHFESLWKNPESIQSDGIPYKIYPNLIRG